MGDNPGTERAKQFVLHAQPLALLTCCFMANFKLAAEGGCNVF